MIQFEFVESAEERRPANGTKYRTYHLRKQPTKNGTYENYEKGNYFLANILHEETRDDRGIIKSLGSIAGVMSVSGHDYQLTIQIGRMFDWDKDSIHEKIVQILEEKL